MNVLKGSTNLIVIEPKDAKLDDITIALPPAKTISIRTATYENYHVKVMTQTNNVENAGSKLLITNIIAVKKDNDLIVTAADASKVIFRGFYTLCDTDGACTVTLGGEALAGAEDREKAGVTITPDSPVGEALSDGSFIVYTYADSGVLADMVTEVDGLTLGLSDLPEGTVSYIPTNDEETNDQGTNDQGTHWWWVAGGIALAAVGIKAYNDNTDNNDNDNTVKVIDLADTTPPTITIDAVATNDTINANEVAATIIITGSVDEAGSSVMLRLAGNERTATVLESESGSTWSYTLTAADISAMGEGAKTITVTAMDAAGNKSNTASREITVDTAPPTITIDAVATNDTINANEVAAPITITGSVDEAGSSVMLRLAGNERTAIVLESESGSTWSYTLTEADIDAMGQGAETITVTAMDAAGNKSNTATRDITVDTAPPTITIDAVATDDIINANEIAAPITITGSVDEAGSSVDEAGSSVMLSLAGNERTATVLESESGSTWSYTLTAADIDAMGEGAEIITVTAMDAAGNKSNTVSREITVDTAPPTITIDAVATNDIINANEITATIITGSVDEEDSSVTLSLGGNERMATVSESGSTWSYTLTPADISAMEQGTETITATATDTAGNEHTASREITVDTILPTITINDITADNIINANGADATITITGTVETGSTVSLSLAGNEPTATVSVTGTIWSYTLTAADIDAMAQGDETITATATDTVGNKGTDSQIITLDTLLPAIAIDPIAIDNIINSDEQTAIITGSVEAGSSVILSFAGNEPTATVLVTDTTWSYALTEADITAMGEGAETFTATITATATDTAGNANSVTQSISVDTTIAAITTTATIAGESGESTGDTMPPLTGTVTADLTNGQVLAIYDGATRLGVATVTGTDPDWTWTYTPSSPLTAGSHSFTAQVENQNTRQQAPASAAHEKQIYNGITVEVTDDKGTSVGVLASSAATDDDTPTLSGMLTTALGAGEELAIYDNDGDGTTKFNVITVNGDNSWTFTATDALADGSYTFTAVIQAVGATNITDARVMSEAIEITIDTSAPTQTVTIDTVSDDVSIHGSAIGNLVTGATTDDTTPTLAGTLTAALTASQVLAIYDGDGATKLGVATVTGTDWTYTPSQTSALTAGSHSFTAQVESLANGLQGAASTAHVVNVNSGISMTTRVVNPERRYILLKQTGATTNELYVNEVNVFSAGVNVALDKAVTAGPYDIHAGWLPSKVTNNDLDSDRTSYASNVMTTDNWLLIDLGANYAIDSVNVYASSDNSFGTERIHNVAIFASSEDLSSLTYDMLTAADSNAINLGGTGSTPDYKTSLTTPAIITLSGMLTTALGADEELAIYYNDGTTKLGVATVNGDNSWTFTTDALAEGLHTFTAVIQAAGATDIANGRVISAASTITVDTSTDVPTQTVTIDTVSDDVNTHGSAVGNLVTGATTDDTTPTLAGTLSAALTGSQVLAVYADDGDNDGDGATRLGEATITGAGTDLTWTYTPSDTSALTAGSHHFTARVESFNGLQGTASNAHVVNVNSGISMTATYDANAITGVVNPGGRYILLKQTGASTEFLSIGEVEVFSAGVNVALGKTVTVPPPATYFYNGDLSHVTDGNIVEGQGYGAEDNSNDNWLLIDLGAYYSVDSVNVYARRSNDAKRKSISNVDIFVSNENLSSQTYAALTADDSNAINLGGTGSTPDYLTTLTTPVINITNDSTPTLSGTLTTTLSEGEELAIYDGTTKLGVATFINGDNNADNAWTFTTDELTDGSHTLKAVIQAADVTAIANGRVISDTIAITIDTNTDAPTQTVTIVTVSDDVNTHGSAVVDLVTGASTDDDTPTLAGTLSAALTSGQVLAIYDGATKVGDATVTGTNWDYTPSDTSALTAGSHSFTAQVESIANGQPGLPSIPHVVNVHSGGISMTVTDNMGGVMGAVTSGVRYILLKQTGASANQLYVNEVEVFSAGVNIAAGKEVTAGYRSLGDWFASGVTDGSLERIVSDGYAAEQSTNDNWLLVDLGAYHAIDRVNVYALGTELSTDAGDLWRIRNVDIFASNQDISRQSYATLTAADSNAIRLGGTGGAPAYKTTLTTPVVNITDDSTPTLSGALTATLGASEELAIYDGTTKLGVATVNNADNAWTFTTDELTDGSYTFTAVIQAAGETDIANGRVISDTIGITIDTSTTAPTQTVTIDTVSDDVSTHGSAVVDLVTGASTDDTTPTLTGTLSAALTSGQVLAIYNNDGDGATKLGNATITGAGTDWTYTPSQTSALTAGSYSFTARVENLLSGLQSTASNAHVVNVNSGIDMTVTDDAGGVTGVIAADTATDDSTPILSGMLTTALGADEELAIYDGTTKLGVATVNGANGDNGDNGANAWTFTATEALTDGSHALKAVIQAADETDIANGRVISDTIGITIDTSTTAPTQTVTIDTVSDDVSTYGSAVVDLVTGASTDDTTPTLTGTLSAALTSEQVLAIYNNDGDGATKLGNATITGAGTDWTYTPSDTSALAAGSYSFTARVENLLSGLHGAASNAHVVNVNSGIDMTVTDDAGGVTEVIASGTATDDATPTFSGSLTTALGAGEELAIYDGTMKLGVATTFYANESWTFTPTDALPDGSHTFTAVIQRIGNTAIAKGRVISEAIGITIDTSTTAPTQTVTIVAVNDDVSTYGSVVGNLATDESTDDTTPTLTGILSTVLTGSQVLAIYGGDNDGDGATRLGEATVNSNTWTYTPSDTSALAAGSYSFTARVESPANGLHGAASNAHVVNVNSGIDMIVTDDAGSVTGVIAADTATDDGTPTLSGMLTTALGADEELAIYDGDGNGSTKLGVATVNGANDDNLWEFTPTDALADGSHTFTAVIQAVNETYIANGHVISEAITISIDSSVTTSSAIATTDPLSGLAVQTYSLASTAMGQTLDFSGSDPGINVVNIAGSGANTVKIDLVDVLQSGINLFNDDNGWVGLDGTDKHQLVVNGDADDTVELAGSWIKADTTTTNSEHTYDVYHLDANNADGRSQVLVDQEMIVLL